MPLQRITKLIDAIAPADLAAWEPGYGRLAEAQVKWEAAHGRPLQPRMTNETLVVRPAEESDLPEILRIERTSFADPWSRESFVTSLELERMRFLVAEERRDGDGGGEVGDPPCSATL